MERARERESVKDEERKISSEKKREGKFESESAFV